VTAGPAARRDGPVRVLYLADRVLTPALDGASSRQLEILRSLQRLGCRITFAAHHRDSFYAFARTVEQDVAALRSADVEVVRQPAGAHLEPLLVARGAEFDVVVMSPYPIAHRYLGAVRRHAPGALAVYNAIDLGHVQHFRRARATGNVPDLMRALDAKRQETALARDADAVLVCSEQERETLLGACPGARVLVVGHVVRPDPSPAPFDARSGLLFLGSFAHSANVDAMRYFVAEVLPAVRRADPGIDLAIVGLDPQGDVTPLAGPGVSVTGWVGDLDAEFARARVFVAPLRWGAGIKIKVLDSLARGVPAVVTPVAAEGLHLVDGDSALVAAEPGAFAAAVVRLHEERELWERVAAGGRAVLQRRFSVEAMDATLSAAVRTATERRRFDAAAG